MHPASSGLKMIHALNFRTSLVDARVIRMTSAFARLMPTPRAELADLISSADQVEAVTVSSRADTSDPVLETHSAEQSLKTRVSAERVELRIDLQQSDGVGTLLVGFCSKVIASSFRPAAE
jgi:hypothetical protein